MSDSSNLQKCAVIMMMKIIMIIICVKYDGDNNAYWRMRIIMFIVGDIIIIIHIYSIYIIIITWSLWV